MKKILIFLFIAIGIITFFGYLADANDGNKLLKKLDKFEKLDNIYYESKISFKYMNLQDVDMLFKQYKRGNNYNVKKISPLSKGEFIFKVEDGKLSFVQNDMMIEGTAEESKADKNIFWFDKITSKEIEPGSIKKIKTPEFLLAQKCDMYSAKLHNTMKDVDICMNKKNIPVYFKYYDVSDFISIPFDINPIKSMIKNSGDVVVNVSDIEVNPEYDSSFDMPKLPENGSVYDVKDIKRNFSRQNVKYTNINSRIDQIKKESQNLQDMQEKLYERNSNKSSDNEKEEE